MLRKTFGRDDRGTADEAGEFEGFFDGGQRDFGAGDVCVWGAVGDEVDGGGDALPKIIEDDLNYEKHTADLKFRIAVCFFM